jgi:hypothetical protein
MARIANVAVGNEGFDADARELVSRVSSTRELQVLRLLVSERGDEIKLAEINAKVEKRKAGSTPAAS